MPADRPGRYGDSGGSKFLAKNKKFFTKGGDKPPPYSPDSKKGDDKKKKPKPIGVPEGYTTPRNRQNLGLSEMLRGRPVSPVVKQGPRYFDGDEFKPAATSPGSIAEVQKAMAAAGLLTEFRYGVWDEQTIKAYKDVLSYANARGVTREIALNEMVNTPQITPGGGGRGGSGGGGGGGYWDIGPDGEPVWVEEKFTPPPLQLKTSNKADLRRVLRTAIIDRLGVGWSQAQVDRLAEMYVAEEERVQRDAYGQEVERMRREFYGEPGADEAITSVSVASPETFLEDEMIRQDPEGYKAGRVVNEMVPAFFNMMQGWGG